MRFAPAAGGRGKRGALRVCYAYLEEYSTVLLVLVYAKTDRDELNPAEKKAIKQLIAAAKKGFDGGIIR